ncbi:MAG TPA: hypothetical protein VFY87_21740 [Geminicoccaceae bacterium]|nr:hypothetical protein [Geminicoccaceae bacterium]
MTDGAAEPSKPAARGAEVSAPRSPLATTKDLAVLAKLPLSALAAWCVPERSWDAVAAQAVRLERRNIAGIAERIAGMVGPDRLPEPALALACRQIGLNRVDQLCFLRSYRPGGWRPELLLEGREHLDAALAAGRGAVLWMAPTVFQWLPAKRALSEAGYRLHHLSHPRHGFSTLSRFGRRWVNPIRTRVEDRYLAERVVLGDHGGARGALRRLTALLRRNAVVSITVAAEGTRQARAPLLGGFLCVASGAPHLAARTGAALLPVVTLRTGPGRFLTRIEAPLPTPPGGSPDDPLEQAVAELARRLEPYVLAHPDQIAWALDCFDPLPPPAIPAAEG